MTHIMFDLETWGTEPGCDNRSIGACVFDPVAGWVGAPGDFDPKRIEYFYLATDNPHGFWRSGTTRAKFTETGRATDRMKYALRRDPATVKWWSEQTEEAQGAFEHPVDLRDALERFGTWLGTIAGYEYEPDNRDFRAPHGLRLWSHGPHFDVSILAAAYKAVDLPVPWSYRAPRDCRTVFDIAGIDDHSAWLEQYFGPLGVPHHALDDAICQARAVCGAYDRAMRMCHQGDRWEPAT